MQSLQFQEMEDSPKVIFDAAQNIFEISGRSLMDDAADFYQKLLDWLEEFAKTNHQQAILLKIKIDYFNTNSTKQLLYIVTKFEKMKKAGTSVAVEWHHLEDDEEMLEAGNDFARMIDLPFSYVPRPE